MTALKCVVEGCDLEYDVVCSFSFYNVNTSSEEDGKRQEWIEGAMHEESECLWRHVSLQLCGYHFELDSQGLWIDSPMLPELLTAQDTTPTHVQTEDDKKRPGDGGFQGTFQSFVRRQGKPQVAEIIRTEHNYCEEQSMAAPQDISRLNVRQLVDTLGYLSLKNLQRKQLWVVKVETDKSEASITQSEQVIAKMQDPKQIIEIVPQSARMEVAEEVAEETPEADASLADNFIYEIAEEQEITMEEVNEIPSQSEEWMVNIIPEENKPKYAYIKHCNTGKKKRHFTADMSEVTFQVQGDFDNYYILPDIDPSSGVEITTSYEPENYIVDEYQHLVLEERPKKRGRDSDPTKKRKKKAPNREPKQIQIKTELGEDWVIQAAPYEQFEEKKGRARRKNKKFLGVDKHVFGIN